MIGCWRQWNVADADHIRRLTGFLPGRTAVIRERTMDRVAATMVGRRRARYEIRLTENDHLPHLALVGAE